MPDLQTLLDQIQRLDKSAKAGPWEVWPQMNDDGTIYPECIAGPENDLYGARGWDDKHYIQEIPEMTMEDAEFIALARTALPQLTKALRAVMELADGWVARGRHDMKYSQSKNVPDDVADHLYEAGQQTESAGQMIRQALTDAMEENNA